MRMPGLSGWFGRGMTGAERKELREILLEGSSRDSLTTALAEADNARIFEEIVGDDGYATQLRDLIHAAEKGGWLPELVEAFASQTQRDELIDRARVIVAAAEARGDASGGAGGGASVGTGKGTLLAGGVILAVAGATGVYLAMRDDPDANLVVTILDGDTPASGREVFVEKVNTKQGTKDQTQSALTDDHGRAAFYFDEGRGSLLRVGAQVPGKNDCWWGDFGFGGANFEPNKGLKRYDLREIKCGGLLAEVSSAERVAASLKSHNKGSFGLGTIDLPPADPRPSYAPLGLPGTGIPVQRKLFTYGFDERVGTARWVAFDVGTSRARGERQLSDFSPDPAIPASMQHNANSYNDGSSDQNRYDRGHLVSLADMRSGATDLENAAYQREAEYFPVVVPQSPGTNRQTWAKVENYARKQSGAFGPIHVIAGPVYHGSGDQTILTLGPQGVPVPAFLYRVLLRPDGKGGWRAIGFIVPNDGSIEREPSKFATSVSRIEQLTGITFFPRLDPALARSVKGNVSTDYFEGKAPQPVVR